ncbi:hypothetical protein EVA_05365 [gut metagenome]|uniref:Uncharacterized protein n=1 Tax=gut metagenome TaxID=749906 RepID=J9GGM0_9ZZZZ
MGFPSSSRYLPRSSSTIFAFSVLDVKMSIRLLCWKENTIRAACRAFSSRPLPCGPGIFPQCFHIPARKDRRNGFHIGVPGIQFFLLLLQKFHLFKGKVAFYLFLFHILLFPDEVLFKGLAHERGSRLAGILVQIDVTGASHHLILRSYSPRSGGFRLFFFHGWLSIKQGADGFDTCPPAIHAVQQINDAYNPDTQVYQLFYQNVFGVLRRNSSPSSSL